MRGLFRIVNTMVWCWVVLSNLLAPVVAEGDFWIEKGTQLFQLGPLDDLPRVLGRALVSFVLWLLCDWIIRKRGFTKRKTTS